jgi:RimJ/RimL family protein N-acetyltransferase
VLLRTPRLLLRSWTPADLDAYFDLYSRWEVMRWLGSHPRRAVTDVDEAARRLGRWHAVMDELPRPQGLWAIVPLDGNNGDDTHATDDTHDTDDAEPTHPPVGTAILLPLDDEAGNPTSELEIGWHLHPDHQGRGLATEAARALMGAAAEAGITRLLALTDEDNLASAAVATRLGMADEGVTDQWFGLTMRQFVWTAG